MSERKRQRLVRCIMCGNKKEYSRHGKCIDCRVTLQFGRYARKGKLKKFLSKAHAVQP